MFPRRAPCHHGSDGDHTGCPESMFMPTEIEVARPDPFEMPAEQNSAVFPAVGLLRTMLVAAQALGHSLSDAILNETCLSDGTTSLREYLEANPKLYDFVMPGSASRSDEVLFSGAVAKQDGPRRYQRWEFCPLLRAGPLAICHLSRQRVTTSCDSPSIASAGGASQIRGIRSCCWLSDAGSCYRVA